ncbi:MAG: MBL fold metallo-hydrolase [Alphaproteobacteria bacterium]|nr:MBL fold metallo-hydrolase [Alphaproteobacteria bacterium]
MSLCLRLLGTGSSGGVPRLHGGWGLCDPDNPKNHRTRCSLLVSQIQDDQKTQILIDTSPDMRQQLLQAQVQWLDAVLFTHDHADQTHGIDDLRPLVYGNRKRIKVFMDEATAATMNKRFGYCFEQVSTTYPSILEDNRITTPYAPLVVAGAGGAIEALPFRVHHGDIEALGFRIGNIAYTPDLNGLPEESHAALAGLDCWIIDALRRDEHPTHLSLEAALKLIETFSPKQAILTNMHIDMDYETLCKELPPHIRPAYDGMELLF